MHITTRDDIGRRVDLDTHRLTHVDPTYRVCARACVAALDNRVYRACVPGRGLSGLGGAR